ncbi:MAG: VWA domain-containing protein [Candidatus Omnitrophota bacterium]
MQYGNPQFEAAALILFTLLLFLLRSRRRRRVLMERFAQREVLDAVTVGFSRRRKTVKASFLFIAVFLMVFSLLRPQWGFEWEEVKRRGLDILVAMDTSKSMLARDVRPNRLDRSRLAVKDMVRKLKGDRIGLIAFAGRAFLQCPLTQDYGGFLLALDDLDSSIIPRGGTSISAAIKEAIKVFEGPDKKYKVLVIITDGEDHEGDAVAIAEQANDRGIRIFTVGVGTKEGELISVVDTRGESGFLKDNTGNVVKSRLNEPLLKKIALITGGAYVQASGADFGLNVIYDQKISKLEKRDIESKMKKRYRERFQIFLAAALALLFIEPLVSDKKFRI